ncbi:HIT domain-containing protein [Candidatus Woesearchaeota archaeon]|nr:HIT domain-containing protein [Nanoarchaeota archaeon]MCB9370040.1 HIT domain-containing protein [Candidatus Woesearchaeota archaeon]
MLIIFETDNFVVEAHERPEISREEGGHIKITPKKEYSDRTELSPEVALEMMWLSVLCGEAMKLGLKKQGIELGRINYQENGNWKPHLHLHLYGRAKGASKQKFGDPLLPGHKPGYEALNEGDRKSIREEIGNLLLQEKFKKGNWRFR